MNPTQSVQPDMPRCRAIVSPMRHLSPYSPLRRVLYFVEELNAGYVECFRETLPLPCAIASARSWVFGEGADK